MDYRPISELLLRDRRGGIVQAPIIVKDEKGVAKTAMLLGKDPAGNILIQTEASQGKLVPVKPNTLARRQ